MKEEKMLRAFSFVDDELVKNAAPKGQKPNKSPILWKKLAYIAVAACLMLAVVLPFAFSGGHRSVPVATTDADTPLNPTTTVHTDKLPSPVTTASAVVPDSAGGTVGSVIPLPSPGDTQPPLDIANPLAVYRDSEYYPLIVKLDAYFRSQDSLGVIHPESNQPSDTPENGSNLNSDANHTDAIKKHDAYTFYLREKQLEIYSLSQGEMVCESVYKFASGSFYDSFWLDGESKLLVIGKERYQFVKGAFTERSVLILLDVSDPANIRELHTLKASGLLDCFYEKDGCLILVNKYTVPLTPQYSEPSSFVPEVEHDEGERTLLLMNDFVMNEREMTSRYYTVVYALHPETLAVISCKVVLGAPWAAYVSDSAVYISSSRRERLSYISQDVSDLQRFTYQDGILIHQGELTLSGSIEDASYMNEKDGILRVVTEMSYFRPNASMQSPNITYIGASFYAVSLRSFKIYTSLDDFSPDGEDVWAVCYDGNKVYVSTGRGYVGEAPLIMLDLSDLAHISCTVLDDVGRYATTLMPFENGNILGIGNGGREFVGAPPRRMVEIFRGEGDELISVDRYYMENATIAEDEKAYYIDPERQLVGLAASMKDEDGSEKTYYILLHFDGETLAELFCEEVEGSLDSFRATLSDGYLYLFSDRESQIIEVTIL